MTRAVDERIVDGRARRANPYIFADGRPRLAQQLLSDPSGGLVTVPRIPRVRKSQAEILVTALV